MTQEIKDVLEKMEKMEEHLMKIEGIQKQMQTDYADMLSCKDDLQKSVDTLSVIVNGDKHDQDNPGLKVIVLGSTSLGVKPMREILGKLEQMYDRLRWVWGIIGVIVIAITIFWLNSLIGG